MIDDDTIRLLKELCLTDNPTQKLLLIHKHCFEFGSTEQMSSLKELIKVYEDKKEKKHQQGLKAVKARKTNPKSKSNYSKPSFFPGCNGSGNCATCGFHIQKGSNAFLWKKDGKFQIYCSIPSCFPAEHKQSMLNDEKYIKTMAVKK